MGIAIDLLQMESYAPGHQARFGNLKNTADIHGDLIFDGFEHMSGAPNGHDGHDLDLPSDSIRDIAPAAAPDLNPGQSTSSEDGWMDPAPQASHSLEVEPNTGLTSKEARDSRSPGSYPIVGSSPRAPEPAEPGWAPVMEFTTADIVRLRAS